MTVQNLASSFLGYRCEQRHRVLLVILAVGLVARLAALLLYLSTHHWMGETWEYEIIANNFLAGHGLSFPYNGTIYRSYVVPVFPLICAFLHFIGGPGLGVYYVFHLSLAMGIIWLSYTIARLGFGTRTAEIAALLIALEPGLVIYHSYKVDLIALSTFLLLLGTYLFILMARSRDGFLAALFGLVVGIGVLTRIDLISLMALPVIWVIAERKQLQAALKPVALMLFMASLVVTPWVVRNYDVHGRFVFLTTVTGEILWRGNNPNTTGTSITMDAQSQFAAAPEEFRNKILASNEVQQDALFNAEAFRYIKGDPAGFVWRDIQRVYYFWWFSPTFAAHYYEWAPGLFVALYQILCAAVLVFMLLGVWVAVREGSTDLRQMTLYLLSLPVSISLIHSINYVEGRHKIMVLPIVLIFTAHGIAALWNYSVRKGSEPTHDH